MELILRILRRVFWIVCRFCPVDRRKIVMMSYYGRDYSDNPKYIAEILRERGAKLKYYWVCLKPEEARALPAEFKVLRLNSFPYIFHMSTARVWVDNARKYYCMKRKGQYYLQTWHGSFGLKKIEKDAVETLSFDYIRMAKRDSSQCDLIMSNSRTLTRLYYDAFWYTGEVMEKGLPRNDRLFNYTIDDAAAVRAALELPDGVNVALYAPTFRKNHRLDVYDMDYDACISSLEQRFGGQWMILLRLHPNVFRLSESIAGVDGERVYNASFYPDIQELYMISDLLITDYSSVMFDFLITRRPCLLYASDVEQYRAERDYFIEIDSLPFPLSCNNTELCDTILAFDADAYRRNADAFYAQHGFCDTGHASQHAADWIMEKTDCHP